MRWVVVVVGGVMSDWVSEQASKQADGKTGVKE
jgi:hypothetical protein